MASVQRVGGKWEFTKRNREDHLYFLLCPKDPVNIELFLQDEKRCVGDQKVRKDVSCPHSSLQ